LELLSENPNESTPLLPTVARAGESNVHEMELGAIVANAFISAVRVNAIPSKQLTGIYSSAKGLAEVQTWRIGSVRRDSDLLTHF
jgi:hypothetical protein